jgi:Domain of unknown function (DUF5348)
MNTETAHTLVPSTNRGRYALDDPEQGHDLTSGEQVAIVLGGQWIEGRVEHANLIYAIEGCISPHNLTSAGYSFIASDGRQCLWPVYRHASPSEVRGGEP